MAASPVRLALQAKLAADSALAELVGTRIYFQQAPQNAVYPLVIFHKQAGTPRWTLAGPPSRFDLWTVKGVTTGSSSATQAEAIDAAIEAAINRQSLSVDGRDTILKPLRESDMEYPDLDNGTLYRHCGGTYRLITE